MLRVVVDMAALFRLDLPEVCGELVVLRELLPILLLFTTILLNAHTPLAPVEVYWPGSGADGPADSLAISIFIFVSLPLS